MANTLTNLISDVYAALNVVSRELTGFIPSVLRDSSADRVAANQTLRIPVAPANSAGGNITPGMSLPAAADQTIPNASLTISKQRFFPFSWSGEEQYAMNSNGPGALTLQQNQIAEALRAAVNEMETDIATAAYKGASRAYGTAGTTPFATAGDYTDASFARKILVDNGAPTSDLNLVIGTGAGANIRGKQFKANETGDVSLLRQGVLLDVHGFAIRESAKVQSVTKGTGAAYTTNAAGYAVGATDITLITGSGTILAGDVVTFAGDTNKYVVKTGIAAPGTITLQAPGLLVAIPAAATAITVGNNYTANVALSRNGVLFATRLPAIPSGGDMAKDRMTVTDPLTGLSFEVAVYGGFHMNVYHVSACWGVSVIKPEHVGILLG